MGEPPPLDPVIAFLQFFEEVPPTIRPGLLGILGGLLSGVTRSTVCQLLDHSRTEQLVRDSLEAEYQFGVTGSLVVLVALFDFRFSLPEASDDFYRAAEEHLGDMSIIRRHQRAATEKWKALRDGALSDQAIREHFREQMMRRACGLTRNR